MAQRGYPKRRKRHRMGPQELGIRLLVIGIGLLIGSWILGSSPFLRSIAMVVRIPGWLSLVFGLVILCVERAKDAGLPPFNPANSPSTPVPLAKPHARHVEPELLHDVREVIDVVSREPHLKEASASPIAHMQATEWTAQVFADVEWRRFEAVCEALFAQHGFRTQALSHGADGGVDIWLYSQHAQGPVSIVQCKHWQAKQVGVKELREFYGVMTSHKLQRGTYATSSTFSTEARRFAQSSGIHLLDGAGLLSLIAKRTSDEQQALLRVAYEGEFWRPTCARCGVKMVERIPSGDKRPFWGCRNFPRCNSRIQMTARQS